jgi:hypothetical protein
MSSNADFLSPRHSEALLQSTFFKQTPDVFAAETSVSLDEMKRWYEAGWLSFDPAVVNEYDERESVEVQFVKAVVRFGLSDAMIHKILSTLNKPYCYNTNETFYSFERDSWITLPPAPDPMETIEENIESLIENENLEVLELIKERIDAALENS